MSVILFRPQCVHLRVPCRLGLLHWPWKIVWHAIIYFYLFNSHTDIVYGYFIGTYGCPIASEVTLNDMGKIER